MKENESALYSHYLIDGTWQEMTPADLLDECMEYDEDGTAESEDFGRFEDVIDESVDLPVTSFTYDSGKNREYAEYKLNKSKEKAIQYAQICAKQYLDYTKRAVFLNEVLSLQLHK